MHDDINLKGVILKPDVGLQHWLKWIGYALVLCGVFWWFATSFTAMDELAILGSLTYGTAAAAVIAAGALMLGLARLVSLLSEIRDANHTIVD